MLGHERALCVLPVAGGGQAYAHLASNSRDVVYYKYMYSDNVLLEPLCKADKPIQTSMLS